MPDGDIRFQMNGLTIVADRKRCAIITPNLTVVPVGSYIDAVRELLKLVEIGSDFHAGAEANQNPPGLARVRRIRYQTIGDTDHSTTAVSAIAGRRSQAAPPQRFAHG